MREAVRGVTLNTRPSLTVTALSSWTWVHLRPPGGCLATLKRGELKWFILTCNTSGNRSKQLVWSRNKVIALFSWTFTGELYMVFYIAPLQETGGGGG